MEHELPLEEIQKEWHGSLKAYLIGFVSSIILTAASFALVMTHALTGKTLLYTITGLGFAQAIVQLLFFLHLGQERRPRWESVIFFLMVFALLIIVLGTLWIMYDLDKRVMMGM